MDEYKDWLGQSIEVGSPVLYAISNSHYAEVVWGEVLAITPVEPSRRWTRNSEGEQELGPEYYPYGRKFKLKIQPHYQNSDFRDEDEGASWGTRGVEFKYSQADDHGTYVRVPIKPVTIQNVEKVVVFPLPEGARERLESLIEASIVRGNARWDK